MRWKKNGLIYVANGDTSWAQSHAYLPTPVLLNEEIIRVFITFRDGDNIGRVGYVDVAADNPLKILTVSKRPAFDIGQLGTFDDHGVTPLSIVQSDNKLFLFYNGWQLGVTVPYYMFTGLAVSEDGGQSFVRVSKAPILDRSNSEPIIRTASFVIKDGDEWKMWYSGGNSWVNVQNKIMPGYEIRYLTSNVLTDWSDTGKVCITPDGNDEFGLGRPFVLKSAGAYQMFYSVRNKSKGYRLGYAESLDGLNWQRKDENIGIDVSASGWDSTMICFAAVQATRYGTYMFYNGNNYGETGFGVATLANE